MNKKIYKEGDTFGRLTIINEVESFRKRQTNGKFKLVRNLKVSCSCGQIVTVKEEYLHNKHRETPASCGCALREKRLEMGKKVRVPFKVGERFGRLVLTSEAPDHYSKKGKPIRRAMFLCDCGNTHEATYSSVKAGDAHSCGCLKVDINKVSTKKHGGRYTRLYRCWQSMKARAKSRDECCVYEPWLDFATFREWAKASGYDDSLILCRNQDKGDYHPDNVRWDTLGSNTIEAMAKYYYVTPPQSGKEILIYNLSEFCREKGLNITMMHRVMNGDKKDHKGYTIRRKIDEDQ